MPMIIKCADFKKVVVQDSDADASFLEQEGFEDRLKEYKNGDFYFNGICAEVELRIPFGKETFIIEKLRSPGLWCVESDSDESYIEEVFQDQCGILADMLTELGKLRVVK